MPFIRPLLCMSLTAMTLFSAAYRSQSRSTIAWQAPEAEEGLKVFLRKYVAKQYGLENTKVRYLDKFVDLNGDGRKEVVVLLIGPDVCGSGGCSLLVLAPEKTGYRVLADCVTNPPVRILSTVSHGWHDIAVFVQGGGILDGYEAELRFDGKTYPEDPESVPRTVGKKPPGRTIISSESWEDGKPLLPAN
jgi:hypothetical protein